MSLGDPYGTHPKDRKCKIKVDLGKIGLERDVREYVRVVAGPHYHARGDRLIFAFDKYPDPALNKRLCFETLAKVVKTSKQLLQTHGPLQKPKVMPKYAH